MGQQASPGKQWQASEAEAWGRTANSEAIKDARKNITDWLGFHASVSGSLKYPEIMHDKKITNQGYSGIRLEH